MKRIRFVSRFVPHVAAVSFLMTLAPALGSDHADTQFLINAGRHDARITDLHVFMRGTRIVFAVSVNPNIPAGQGTYAFTTDVTFTINIDNDSLVTFDNPGDLATFGGTIPAPENILEDIVLQVRFDANGDPILTTSGLAPGDESHIEKWSGVRDDPFIRGNRAGRNVGSFVLEMPVADVLGSQPTILIWASSAVDGMPGSFQDMVGRSIRSQLMPNLAMNTLHPNQHLAHLGLVPDVMIYNTSLPASFPNGRDLPDDVVDLVGDPGLLATDAPFPDANDVPFLTDFPYLAPPHPAPPIPTVSSWGLIILTLFVLIIGRIYFGRELVVAPQRVR
jgi:hypothetical protein